MSEPWSRKAVEGAKSEDRAAFDRETELMALLEERDRTIQQLESELQSQSHLAKLGLIVSGVAHEINNSLTGAIGFVHLAKRSKLSEEPRLEKMLTTVSGELTQCATLTRNLVHYSRKFKPAREPVELSVVVEKTVGARRTRFLEEDVTVIMSLEAGATWIMGVDSQIEWIVETLLDHSFEALLVKGRPGEIRVSLATDSEQAMLQVSDMSGPHNDSTRTLESFYRDDEAGPGQLVGLVVAKSIMKDHGGRMQRIRSQGGAIHLLRFPLMHNLPKKLQGTHERSS